MVAGPLAVDDLGEQELLERAAVGEEAAGPQFGGEAGDCASRGDSDLGRAVRLECVCVCVCVCVLRESVCHLCFWESFTHTMRADSKYRE